MARAPLDLSERVEYIAEALTVALDVAPQLDENERAQLAEVLPFATPYFLDGLVAAGSGQATQDTQLITQLLQQVQASSAREKQLTAELETERARSAAAPAAAPSRQRQPSPRGQQLSQQQRYEAGPGSPRSSAAGSSRAQPARPPRAQARRPSPAPSADSDEQTGRQQQQEQRQGQPRRQGQRPPRGKAPSPVPTEEEEQCVEISSGAGYEDSSDGAPSVPWSEFAGDDEGEVVQPADDDEAAEMERRRTERKEMRFNSISEEIKAVNSGLISADEISTVTQVDNREACPQCGRKFLPDRLKRHVKGARGGSALSGVCRPSFPALPRPATSLLTKRSPLLSAQCART